MNTNHPIQEPELELAEYQLRLVSELASVKPIASEPKFLNDERVLSGREGFEGINWGKAEEKGQKILSGRNSAILIVPPLPAEPVQVEITFRRFLSEDVAKSMKVFLNGEQLSLATRNKKRARSANVLSLISSFFSPAEKLGTPPYVFQSQAVTGLDHTTNLLAFHFSPRSSSAAGSEKSSIAMIISVSFKNA